jgi:hypothetical protein
VGHAHAPDTPNTLTEPEEHPVTLWADAIPHSLRTARRWVAVLAELRDGKVTKVPYRVADGRPASVTRPEDWATWEDAVALLESGRPIGGRDGQEPTAADAVGFVLGDGVMGIDLDGVMDPATGRLTDEAAEVVGMMNSYTEVSLSGTGVHILFLADTIPGGKGHRCGFIEVYPGARYFVTTGFALPDGPTELQPRQAELEAVYARFFGQRDTDSTGPVSMAEPSHPGFTDAEVIQRCRHSNTRFGKLLSGDRAGYPSPSEADAAAIAMLSFWSRDPAQIERILRASKLTRPRWDERRGEVTWLALNIANGLQKFRTCYTPRKARVPDGRPSIAVGGRPLRDVTEDALTALVAKNTPPVLFVRAGELVTLGRDEHGAHIIVPMDEDATRGHMARAADWVRETKTEPRDVPPPIDVVRDLATAISERVREHAEWPFPPLRGIVTGPAVRPDLSLLTAPGYDAETRFYYAPSAGLTLPEVSDAPTGADVGRAVSALTFPFSEFPWRQPPGGGDFANYLAAMLTPALLPALADAHIPLCLIDAHKMGTGKSLLSDAVAIVHTGRPAPMVSAPGGRSGAEEWRKNILSMLLPGPSVLVLDNVRGKLESSDLCRALTSSRITDRILGHTRMATVESHALWIANGNNVQLGGDMPRRCVPIRLEAASSRPWAGRTFGIPDLRGYLAQHRGELLWAVLTLVRAWASAGQPVPDDVPILGSFETWCRMCGGILAVAGVPGFLANVEELWENSAPDEAEWEGFLATLWAVYRDAPFSAQALASAMNSATEDLPMDADAPTTRDLRDAAPGDLCDGAGRITARSVGYAMREHTGTRYGIEGFHVARAGQARDRAKTLLWTIARDR